MASCCSQQDCEDKFKAFWELKAKSYPSPFDADTFRNTSKTIAMVKSAGVKTSDAKILDIGCGTGIYTLLLAMEAQSVTGLDFSDAMIARLTDEIRRNNIRNADVIKASWHGFDVVGHGSEKAFQIVWSAMSMAVRTEEDLKKMEQCCQKWCVYIGFGGSRRNTLLEEVFKLHNLQLQPPSGALDIFNMLTNIGRHPTIDYFDTSWTWTGSVDDAIEDIAGHVEVQGAVARRDEIRRMLLNQSSDGVVRHVTYVQEGVVVWQVV